MTSSPKASTISITPRSLQQTITPNGEHTLPHLECYDEDCNIFCSATEPWHIERVNQVSLEPSLQTPSTERSRAQQKTKAALSELKRRLSVPALDASIRRLIHFLSPKPDWGKSRAENPNQYRRQEERVERYLSMVDPYWSSTSTEATLKALESLPMPKTQPLTNSWFKCTVKPSRRLLKRKLEPSSNPEDQESPLDEALPDSEIFRRLGLLHNEQKKVELEIWLRDLSDVRIAGESSSCGARHISAQWEELDKISQYVPCVRENNCISRKSESGSS
ncbi:MAG: hypothetical protein M1812_003491 [Candelaria pacifica]|nr:MAG: hypothetical protein M1812_003491 [Candelaria pacifica]